MARIVITNRTELPLLLPNLSETKLQSSLDGPRLTEREESRAIKGSGLMKRPFKALSPNRLEELLSSVQEKVVPLFHRYSIAFAYLAGSWAREKQQWWSDIDVFVSWPQYQFVTPKERLDLIVGLNVEASEITHLDAIEIRILEKQALHVQFRIIKEGILLYERSTRERIQFIEKLLGTYYDHDIWYRNYLAQSLSSG